MANQIKVGGIYGSQKQSGNFKAKPHFNIREQSKIEVAKHLIFDCFMTEMINGWQ